VPAQRLAGALVIAQDLARRDLLIPCCQGEVLVMAINALDGDGGTGITLKGCPAGNYLVALPR